MSAKNAARQALRAAIFCAAEAEQMAYGTFASDGSGDYAHAEESAKYAGRCAADVRAAASDTAEAVAIACAATRHALYQGAAPHCVEHLWRDVLTSAIMGGRF